MNALRLLAKVEALGIALRAEDDRLLYRPRESVPADLKAELSVHKEKILEWLSWPADGAESNPDRLSHRLRLIGQVVSTPRGPGRLVAVLPELVAVDLFEAPRRLTNFLPCEVEPTRRSAS